MLGFFPLYDIYIVMAIEKGQPFDPNYICIWHQSLKAKKNPNIVTYGW